MQHKVAEDLGMIFQDNFHLIDTHFFLHQDHMMNLRLKSDFTRKFLVLEEFHKKSNLQILEPEMDLIVKIQDRYKLSGDLPRIFTLNHQVVLLHGLYHRLLL